MKHWRKLLLRMPSAPKIWPLSSVTGLRFGRANVSSPALLLTAMRVIPVIDLMQGQVVRGIAGNRSEYRPIESQIAADARPATVARALVERFGFKTVYVADLDAIQGGQPDLNAWQDIRRAGLSLWIDAGVGDPSRCLAIRETLKSRRTEGNVIIGLESFRDPNNGAWSDVGTLMPNLIFSLDLKNGMPIHHIGKWHNFSAVEIGRIAAGLGFHSIIVLDLADVGTSQGTRTLALCQTLANELHPVRIIAGGGVRGLDDLKALADVGCSAALVASALHDGRLTPEHIRQIEDLTD